MPYADKETQAAAQRRHYESNRAAYVARSKEGKVKTRAKVKEAILEYLKGHPCIDCGEKDPVVLEFDHRDGTEKGFAIADGVRRALGVSKVMEEIAKCDVRCANCHRRRTYKQRGFSHKV